MKPAASSWVFGLAAIGLALATPAIAQTASPQAKKGGTLIHGHVSGMDHFDPAMFCTTVQLETAMHMYESLVMMGDDYSAKPMLASKVDVAPDGKKFTFTLRQGVKFHNGKTMSSADVLATMQRYAKISPNAPVFAQGDNRNYNGSAFDGFVDRPRQQANIASTYSINAICCTY